jgi:hypothetical protein
MPLDNGLKEVRLFWSFIEDVEFFIMARAREKKFQFGCESRSKAEG